MIGHKPFLHTIIERPNEDGPRLVYCDWLEEQGGSDNVLRAELIRVQCEIPAVAKALDGCWCDDGRGRDECDTCGKNRFKYESLVDRQNMILGHHGYCWLGFPPITGQYQGGGIVGAGLLTKSQNDTNFTFRRGFVEVVEGPVRAIFERKCHLCPHRGMWSGWLCSVCNRKGVIPGCAAVLFRNHPVRRVNLTDAISIREYGGGDDRLAVYRNVIGETLFRLMFSDAGPEFQFAEYTLNTRKALENCLSEQAVRLGRQLADAEDTHGH